MFEEGKDTYATVEFSDDYVERHYTPRNPLRVHYSVLTDEEKQVYLAKSLQEIERLHFVGRKYLISQPLQFPRIRRGSLYGMSPTYAAMFVGANKDYEVPECIKQAQVENALGILENEILSVSTRQMRTLNTLGIIKNSKIENTGVQNEERCPIQSERAYLLLKSWLGGAYVC